MDVFPGSHVLLVSLGLVLVPAPIGELTFVHAFAAAVRQVAKRDVRHTHVARKP